MVINAREAVENERTKIAVRFVDLAQQRVDVLRSTCQSLHVGPAPACHPFGGEIQRHKDQERDKQTYADEDQQDLPANMLNQGA